MSATATDGVGRIWNVAPLLLRVRRGGDARGVLDALAVAAFAVTQVLLLDVVGGLLMFVSRSRATTNEFERSNGSVYILLAAFAVVLLIVPLLGLGSAAARLGASRREQRLARLRLLGAGPADVTAWTTLEVLRQAAAGVVVGTLLAYATCPGWQLISFQGRRIGAFELAAGPLTLLGVSAGVLLMALASALVGLRRVRITPLGVARRSHAPEVHVVRVLAVLALLVVWIAAGGMLRMFDIAVAIGITLAFLAALMGGINLAGPYVVKLFGTVLARTAQHPARMLAGRRLVADPQAAWRSISALSLTSFIAGCTVLLPFTSDAEKQDPAGALFARDITTGTMLTMAIAFLITAVSTGVTQAASILERGDQTRSLALTGAPVALQHQARRREVLAPVLLAVVPSVVIALLFQLPLVGTGLAVRGMITGLGLLMGELLLGIGLVVIAEECCGPLQRREACEPKRKAD